MLSDKAYCWIYGHATKIVYTKPEVRELSNGEKSSKREWIDHLLCTRCGHKYYGPTKEEIEKKLKKGVHMKKARWVIQDNLISENDRNQFQAACDKLGIAHFEVKVVPFSEELPRFPISDAMYENIYYGSTTFMNNLYKQLDKPKGLFYNHETFSMENYFDKWGEHMLNYGAEIMTVEEFINMDSQEFLELIMFLRPDGDGKEFDGQAGKVKELKDMVKRMMDYESPLEMDSKLIFGQAYNIHREWRNYIVNGKVVTSSRYRKNFRLSKSGTDIPEDMIKFVEDRCKEYQPHDIFAMDIAEVKDGDTMKYFIIECGCMNSVGFYHADIEKYVKELTKYIEESL